MSKKQFDFERNENKMLSNKLKKNKGLAYSSEEEKLEIIESIRELALLTYCIYENHEQRKEK